MLTQDQLEQLEPLTKHPKYGKLLSDAIEIWKQEDVTPIWINFGIVPRQEFFRFDTPDKKQCCLLGASLVNNKIINKEGQCCLSNTLIEKYSISEFEIDQIMHGFDMIFHKIYDSEPYLFGKQIREIVLPLNEV